MTELEALDKSIKHWEDNVKALKKNNRIEESFNNAKHWWYNEDGEMIASFSNLDCALCTYWNNTCTMCCLFHYAKGCCPSSAWGICNMADGKHQILKAAKNMVAELKKVKRMYLKDWRTNDKKTRQKRERDLVGRNRSK